MSLSPEYLQVLFAKLLPAKLIDELAAELKVVQRERKIDIRAFVRTLILTVGTPEGGRQAEAFYAYGNLRLPGISRAAFYRRFDEKLAALLAKMAQHVMAYAQDLALDLPCILGTATDWWVVDSETVKLRDSLKSSLPGCGDYAAVKVHKRLSIGTGCPVSYHFSPAKEHDSVHLDIDESWRGYGLLADLGYASLARIKACQNHGVAFVIRLKENWKAKVDQVGRGTLKKALLPGTDLDLLIEQDVLVLDEKAIDLDVRVGQGSHEQGLRLVILPSPKGHICFLTNLPATVGPWQVGDLYRIRWEIELSNKLDKSVHRLDEGTASTEAATHALLHASLIASTMSAILVHEARLKADKKKKEAPLHLLRVGRLLARGSYGWVEAMNLDENHPEIPHHHWKNLSEQLPKHGEDPNWRKRPSTLDQLRGAKVAPKKKKPSVQALRELK